MSRKTQITRAHDAFSEAHENDILAELPDLREPLSWEARTERLWRVHILPRLERLEAEGQLSTLEAGVLAKGRAFLRMSTAG